ncbi:MAG: competence protein [Firmicutes bacterium]|nr:competence protein [Bacillota bacterium]
MSVENWIELASGAVAATALLINRRGMKRYIPVGLFANLYADFVCVIAIYGFGWWHYPVRLVTESSLSFTSNKVVIPILAMFFIRYLPPTLKGKILCGLGWAAVLTGLEYIAAKHTQLIEYGHGYEFYYSFLLWCISWLTWYGFHTWFYRDHG